MSILGISKFVIIFVLVLISLNFVSAVRINEVMLHTNNTLKNEWVEIYNDNNETIVLKNWIIRDLQDNDTINLTISPYNYSLIVDNNVSFSDKRGCQAVYSLLNNSNFSCFEVAAIGGYGLNDNGESIFLYDNSLTLISNFSWSINIQPKGYSWQFYNNSWQSCQPTPGAENFCPVSTNTSTGNTTQNTTIPPNLTQKEEIKISLDYDNEVYNSEEFEVKLTGENLENYDYDAKIYVEYEEEVISQIYDEDEEKWVSGRYYVSGFSGPRRGKQ